MGDKNEDEAVQVVDEVDNDDNFTETEFFDKEKVTTEDLEALSPQELKMAEESGLIDKAEEGETQEGKEVSKETKKEDDSNRLPTFDEVDKDEALIKQYTSEQKGLFNSWKKNKKSRQQAVSERDVAVLRSKTNEKKLSAIKNELVKLQKGESEATAEELLSRIGDIDSTNEFDVSDDNRPLTMADLKKIQQRQEEDIQNQERQTARVVAIDLEGKKKFDNFDAISDLAKESMTEEDASSLAKSFNDPTISDSDVAELVVKIAKKNSNFGTASKAVKSPVEKAEANARKQKTSASVNTGVGKRLVNMSDLTPEDAAKLSPKEWGKLPEEVRRRILTSA